MARAHSRHSDGHAGFILIVLLAGTVWAHKAFMLKLEHYALVGGLIFAAVIFATVLYKSFKRLRRWRQKLTTENMTGIDHMTGLEFEHYVARLLKTQGYANVRLTEEYDLGVDIIADKDGIRWGIQVKRYSGLVKASAVRQVVTALKIYGCDQAMVVTNSVFSRPACDLADSNDCILVDRSTLTQLITAS